jgi:mRNA-degrading endonuclease RelE of RelBE toxin-antitoxin system
MQRIDRETKQRMERKFSSIKSNPFGQKRLELGEDIVYCARVGNFRILYEIAIADEEISIFRIDKRSRVYKNL